MLYSCSNMSHHPDDLRTTVLENATLFFISANRLKVIVPFDSLFSQALFWPLKQPVPRFKVLANKLEKELF